MATSPMIAPKLATQAGLLPIRNKPVRFAVGAPSGITSNSWKIWATKSGVYIACRDNFKETKVSLHTSTDPHAPGRWRVGFTTESLSKIAHLRSHDENRAWEVWDEPPASLPGTVVAFRLYFPTSELAVSPELRMPKKWKNVNYIECAPPGKLTVLTLFVTTGEPELAHESEPSFRLASFDIGNRRHAQLIAHGEPENDFPDLIRRTVAQATVQAQSAGVVLPNQAYGYFLGRQADGCRFIFGARVHPIEGGESCARGGSFPGASVKTLDELRKSRQAGAMRFANTFHNAAYVLNVAAAIASLAIFDRASAARNGAT